MKKLLILFLLITGFAAARVSAQSITDTASLRNVINTQIVPNASGGITATKLNNILNGIATLMKAYAVDSAWWLAPDTLVLGRRGGFASYKVRIAISPAGSETDPTVNAAAKTITSGDITNWNSKQAALSGSSTVSIVANVVSAQNTTALWNANQLQGRSVSSTAPTTNQVLGWNGSTWIPMDQTGGGGGADGNNYPTGLSYNSGTGNLTMTRNGLGNLVASLDGRFVQSISRSRDSVFVNYGSGPVFAYKDSIGTGGGGGITALTGDVTASGSGSVAATIANNAITTSKILDGNVTIAKLSATGTPSNTTFLRGDNTWAVPAGGGSSALQPVLALGNQKSTTIIDTAGTALNRTGWQGYPANRNTTYGSYGTAGEFGSLGWQQFNGVNPSGRPNVVGMFWGYNVNPDAGRINTGDGAFRFGTETHYETGLEKLFELHLPEFTDTAGVAHRLWSTYLDKTGKRPNLWQTEGDGIQLNKWGDQNTSYAYWGPGRITAFNYKRNQLWPYIEIGALSGVDSVNNVPWDPKWNFKIENVQSEMKIGRPAAVKADNAAIRFVDKIFVGGTGVSGRRDFSQWGNFSLTEGSMSVDNNTGSGQAFTVYYGGVRKFDIGTTFTEVVNTLYTYSNVLISNAGSGIIVGGTSFTGSEKIRANGDVIFSGSATIGATTTPTTGVLLDLQSTAKTSLFTKLNTTTRNGLTAQSGMLHYNSDSTTFEYRDGSAWNQIASREWVRAQGFAVGGGITGGSTNVIPRYGSTTTLVASAITDDGTSVAIGRPTQVTGNFTTTGALAVTGTQVISSGTATTINSSVTRVIVDPGSVLASHTITMPASPQDGQYIEIYFGGSVGGGATVVTSLTISANTGQTLIQPTTPSTAVGGDWISYTYYSATGRWYRRK